MRSITATWIRVAILLHWAVPASALTVTEIIDATGDGAGNVLICANYLAVDSNDAVYVSGFCSDNVFRITPAGTITEIIDATGDGTNPLAGSDGVAVDALGNVYVAGRNSHNAFRITPTGTITQVIDATGDGANALTSPSGVAVDASGNAFVAGLSSHNVFRITPAGTISEIIDATGDGGGNTLSTVLGIAADSSGNAYVAGIVSDNAFRVTPAGTISEIIDATGDGAGNPLHGASAITVDAAGNVYVTGQDSANAFRVTPSGMIDEIIDNSGDIGHPFCCSTSIAVDSGQNVYVSSTVYYRVFQIPAVGVTSTILDGDGDMAGNTFAYANGVAVDSAGNVFAAGVNSNNVFRVDAPTPTPGIEVPFEATLELELGSLPPMIATGTGVAILAGNGALGFDSMRLPQVLTLPPVGNTVTDPLLTAVGAAGITIDATLPAGTFAPITNGQALTRRFALRGNFGICLLVASCPTAFQVSFPFSVPSSPATGLGVGGGASAAYTGGPGAWFADFDPWTVGSATLFSGTQTAMRTGFLHAATSSTTNVVQPNGGLQLIAPSQIRVYSVEGDFQTKVALFSTLTVKFLPEPTSALGLIAGAVGLLLLGRRKINGSSRANR